jgi:hypothetical protein
MWAKFKAMPVLPKILIVCLVLGVLYAATQRPHPRPQPSPYHEGSFPVNDGGGGDEGRGGRQGTVPDQSQALAQFEAQQTQLIGVMRQCQQEMNAATQQMAQAAVNGYMVNNQPACQQQMPQWISQEAYLETEIYRIKTGDRASSVRQITGIAGPTYGGSSVGGRAASSSDPTDPVDRYDREAVRGTSLYVDESGEQHELATRNYYFRDRASGQIIGSDLPDPPNNGRDYEPLQYAERPQ